MAKTPDRVMEKMEEAQERKDRGLDKVEFPAFDKEGNEIAGSATEQIEIVAERCQVRGRTLLAGDVVFVHKNLKQRLADQGVTRIA